MIDLSNITYVSIDGRQNDDPHSPHYVSHEYLKWTILYAEYAKKYFNFGKFLIITPNSKKYSHDFIEFRNIDPMGYRGYSRFVIQNLKDYITTNYCLIYQNDGAIFNPKLWNNEFLKYDYIGAPWPENIAIYNKSLSALENKVGNGGFSLRSKKFLEISSTIVLPRWQRKISEDSFLLIHNKEYLCKMGLKIANTDIAQKFAIEYPFNKNHTIDNTFGFHQPRRLNNSYISIYRNKILKELNLC